MSAEYGFRTGHYEFVDSERTVGTAFSYQITATNSPTSFGASNLPSPLAVNTSTGLISGTPSAAFSCTVGLTATNSAGTGSQNLALTISSGSSPISAANLTKGTDSSGASSKATASISPGANKLDIVSVAQYDASATPTVPTVSGAGGTDGTGHRQVTLFRDLSASPGSGALTIDFGGQSQGNIQWSVDEFSNVNTSGTHGSGAIVQALTATAAGTSSSFTINLAALGSSNNDAYGFLRNSGTNLITAGSGFTELSNNTTLTATEGEWAINQTAVGWTYGSQSVTNVCRGMRL